MRARGAPLQKADDQFEISLGDAPVLGLVDEVQLLAYERGPLSELPIDVELIGLQGPVRFDRRGEVENADRFEVIRGDERAKREIGPGGRAAAVG